jgi:hypothetical protein
MLGGGVVYSKIRIQNFIFISIRSILHGTYILKEMAHNTKDFSLPDNKYFTAKIVISHIFLYDEYLT